MANPPATSDEAREATAAALRAVREEAREAIAPAVGLPAPREIRSEGPVGAVPEPPAAAERTVRPPDNAPVNELWKAPATAAPHGWSGLVFRLFRRVIQPIVDAQVAFNSRQVQLDNEMLEYIEARLEDAHRHYDRVLGQYGQHITDANERHALLQAELVAHVHDLVKRIDLVLGESERGRLSLDASLRELRARLVGLEERIPR